MADKYNEVSLNAGCTVIEGPFGLLTAVVRRGETNYRL